MIGMMPLYTRILTSCSLAHSFNAALRSQPLSHSLSGVDKTALGWFLAGGATHWTAGGLQVCMGDFGRGLEPFPGQFMHKW